MNRALPIQMRYLLGILAAAVAGFLIWYFSDIVIYILVSAVLAIVAVR